MGERLVAVKHSNIYERVKRDQKNGGESITFSLEGEGHHLSSLPYWKPLVVVSSICSAEIEPT